MMGSLRGGPFYFLTFIYHHAKLIGLTANATSSTLLNVALAVRPMSFDQYSMKIEKRRTEDAESPLGKAASA